MNKTISSKIDYIIVIFRNYDLLDIQRELFDRYESSEYRLIIVDNTPDNEKRAIEQRPNELVVLSNSNNEFDGVSHGSAINYGLNFVEADFVCILDSDFFILDRNIHQYIMRLFNHGYTAVGAEFGSGPFRAKFPDKFNNIPVCFCYFTTTEFAKMYTWTVSQNEVNFANSFIETGWRFREHVLNNNIKTLGWKIDNIEQNTKQIYRNEFNQVVGMHYFAGSHFSLNEDIKSEFFRLCSDYV
jgi:hypothetical protein